VSESEREAPLLLAYRALGLGDLLTAVPALRALAIAFPRHRRAIATPSWLGPLVGWLPGRYSMLPAGELEPLALTKQPDVAVNLHGRGPESHRVLLAERPERLIAFGNDDVPWSGPRWNDAEHEVLRWCRLLEEHGVDADPGRLEILAPSAYAPERATGSVIVHPGAAAGARRWPADRWSAVAHALRRAGFRVLVTGSAAERSVARAVARRAKLPRHDVIAGGTDVGDLAALVAAAAAVVSADTGIAHLATALGTPSVTLFGPTSPDTWGPPPSPIHRAIWHGGTGDPHADEPSAGLLSIGVDEALDALDDVMGTTRPRTFPCGRVPSG
jgi:ADP-heptose:LPS heptosyltransferase